jgi:hypothetical protein
MKIFITIFFVAVYAISTGARSQNIINFAASPACPLPAEIQVLHLYGLWRAEFEGPLQGATLLFEKHPELADSIRGGVNRDGAKSLLAGDVDAGELTLEESLDGQRISATWQGTVVENSCGKEFRGTWRTASDSQPFPFVLRKLPSWQ